MLVPDENLIRAVERLIDGGNGHHYYSTIAFYRDAAKQQDKGKFLQKEGMLRRFVLHRMEETAPSSWKWAINQLCQQVNEHGASCGECGSAKLHGVKCKGVGKSPCWSIREACSELNGRCCECHNKWCEANKESNA